jgi:hypothetical protein
MRVEKKKRWWGSGRPEKTYAEIATIEEIVKRTPFGTFCLFLLILNAAFNFLAFVVDNSAVRQAAFGALLTGGTILFGLGVVLGRVRTYIVYREVPDEPQEPRV